MSQRGRPAPARPSGPSTIGGVPLLQMRSTTVDVNGPIHVAQWGEGDDPVFVLVHGLAGSHANWMRVGPRLAERGRVLALDFPGFGLSPVAGRRTDLAAQRQLLHRFLEKTTAAKVVLAGNSMGGLVALVEAGLHPERVAGLILVDSALPVPWGTWPEPLVAASFMAYTVPPLGRRLVRRALDRTRVEDLVAGAFALCMVDPHRIPGDVRSAHVEIERVRQSHREENGRAFADAARSIVLAHLNWGPVNRLIGRITAPTLVVQGAEDRLVRADAALRAGRRRPDWEVAILADTGHMPMLEVPDRFLRVVAPWLDANSLAPTLEPAERSGLVAS